MADLIKSMTVEVFDPATAAKQLGALATKAAVRPVFEHASSLGFKPIKGPKHVQGFKRSYQARVPVTEKGQKVSKLEITYQVQELQKSGSRDKAAIIVTTTKAAGVAEANETNTRLLVAPGGDINKIEESKLNPKTNKVVRTKSWWTRFKSCITGKCSSVCIQALVTCPTSGIVAYLACLALKCGGCSAKCAGCATCDCRWWCKWAVGCCRG